MSELGIPVSTDKDVEDMLAGTAVSMLILGELSTVSIPVVELSPRVGKDVRLKLSRFVTAGREVRLRPPAFVSVGREGRLRLPAFVPVGRESDPRSDDRSM